MQAEAHRPNACWILVVGLFFHCTGSVLGLAGSGTDGTNRPGGPNGPIGPSTPGGPTIGPDGQPLPEYVPAPMQSKRLLGYQYKNAIRDLLGEKASAALKVDADPLINGQASVAASQLSFSGTSVESLEKNAFAAAQAALADPAQKTALIPCTPSKADDAACLSKVIETLGRRVFRRPMEASEKDAYLVLAKDAAVSYSSFDRGVEFAIAALLQSPHFLYLSAASDSASELKLSDSEVAARMSFFLLGTTPSDDLLAAAESGALATPEGVRAQAQKLIESRPADMASALHSFWGEYFGLNGLALVAKDSTLVPNFDDKLKQDLAQETILFMDDVALNGSGDLRDAFDAPYSFVTARVAALYGIAGVTSTTPVKMMLNNGRRGAFGQAAWLSLQAHDTAHSPTYRGKFIREKLLCEAVDAPPPDVSTMLPPVVAGENPTFRERISAATSASRCRACHRQMDDIGFAFEHFDLAGRYRTQEASKNVDTSGNLDGQAFSDSASLAPLLKNDPRVADCLARSFFRNANGRIETASEARPIAQLSKQFTDAGFNLKSLLVELVVNETFRNGQKL